MVRVNNELSLFDPALARKPQLVAVNKIDLPEVRTRLVEIKEVFTNAGAVPHFISASTGRGVPELMAEAMKMLGKIADKAEAVEKLPEKVFRPKPGGVKPVVYKEGDTFVVVAPEIERILARSDIAGLEVRWQLKRQLTQSGVYKALLKAGIKPGDKVRCGNREWEW
jgi:GTP-binding protein